MTALPDFSAFAEKYLADVPQVMIHRVVSDLETPVSAYLKLAGDRTNSFLLESVEGGETLGRYSIIGIRPDAIWRVDGAQADVNWTAETHIDNFTPDTDPPLVSLQKFIDAARIDLPADAPPMAAGVFGYFGYDLVRQMERLPNRPPRPYLAPDAIFIRPTLVAVFDNVKQEIVLVAPVRPRAGVSASDAFDRARGRIAEAVGLLAGPLPPDVRVALTGSVKAHAAADFSAPASNTTPGEYVARVERAKEYISAGDIFQVVLSQRFSAAFEAPPLDLYRALRRTNPSPFLFLLDFGTHALVGSSPEILVRVRDGEVVIRPIAGTLPRGATADEDLAFEKRLLADPKERAEHLMLLDLGRNDVGRTAEIGTVRVTEQFAIERYSHVMHIVSNVVGRLRQGLHPVAAVAAGFPAGTVTGAPKIRAMEIIDELEGQARGPYGGAVGYFSASGAADTCITLRTAVLKDGVMHVQAGAGIVADSDPDAELRECSAKARALFAAAAAAGAMTR